jgi:formylglycine-generating enzyme required for sulfatase activity
MKLFISYRSLDSAKVDAIVARLRSLKNGDGTPIYDIWQDKYSILPGQDWWKSIVQGIVDCRAFIFMVSKESAQNVNCRAELSYARKRNRPIVPILLEGEFSYNPITGKNDIAYWEHIPDELNAIRAQFLFYEGVSFVKQLADALADAEKRGWRDIFAPEPPDPRHADDAENDVTLIFDNAYEAALRADFVTAERKFQRLVDWNDREFGQEALEFIELLREYQEIVRLDQRDSTRYKVQGKWEVYHQKFPKPFIHQNDGLFDPRGFAGRFTKIEIISPSTPKIETLEAAIERAWNFKGTRNSDWTPYIHTFDGVEMCLVPVGKFMMGSDDGEDNEKPAHEQIITQPYWIGRYPVTNAQYKQAVEAEACEAPGEKKYFDDPGFADYPVVYVDLYRVFKYAHWYSRKSNQYVFQLPTECEWEYVARGIESWVYPWGNQFDKDKLIYPNAEKPEEKLKSVYTAFNSSWVGANQLTGNVWQWCRNEYTNYPYQNNDVDENHPYRYRVTARGHSGNKRANYNRCAIRSGTVSKWFSDNGFRLVRSLNDAGF